MFKRVTRLQNQLYLSWEGPEYLKEYLKVYGIIQEKHVLYKSESQKIRNLSLKSESQFFGSLKF